MAGLPKKKCKVTSRGGKKIGGVKKEVGKVFWVVHEKKPRKRKKKTGHNCFCGREVLKKLGYEIKIAKKKAERYRGRTDL